MADPKNCSFFGLTVEVARSTQKINLCSIRFLKMDEKAIVVLQDFDAFVGEEGGAGAVVVATAALQTGQSQSAWAGSLPLTQAK